MTQYFGLFFIKDSLGLPPFNWYNVGMGHRIGVSCGCVGRCWAAVWETILYIYICMRDLNLYMYIYICLHKGLGYLETAVRVKSREVE